MSPIICKNPHMLLMLFLALRFLLSCYFFPHPFRWEINWPWLMKKKKGIQFPFSLSYFFFFVFFYYNVIFFSPTPSLSSWSLSLSFHETSFALTIFFIPPVLSQVQLFWKRYLDLVTIVFFFMCRYDLAFQVLFSLHFSHIYIYLWYDWSFI